MVGIITKNTELPGPVLWPDTDTDTSVTDLAPPLRLLLVNLGISPDPDDIAKDGFTRAGVDVPPSVAIIEAGATEASKASAQQMKLSAVLAGAAGAVAAFWQGADVSVRIVSIAGAAFVVAALLIAIAVVVSSDVRARGTAAAAQYNARSRVAEAYLRGAVSFGLNPPSGASAGNGKASNDAKAPLDAKTLSILVGATTADGITATFDNGDTHRVNRARLNGETSKIEVGDGNQNWREVGAVVSFVPA